MIKIAAAAVELSTRSLHCIWGQAVKWMRFWRRDRLSLSEQLTASRAASIKELLARQREEIELLERNRLHADAAAVREEMAKTKELLRQIELA
jgi:hypothetical protein